MFFLYNAFGNRHYRLDVVWWLDVGPRHMRLTDSVWLIPGTWEEGDERTEENMNGIEWRERELTLSLISRLAGQLPERTLLCSCGKPKGTVHEVGCYGDQREIRLSLTEAERDHLLRVLEETLVPQSPQKPRR